VASSNDFESLLVLATPWVDAAMHDDSSKHDPDQKNDADQDHKQLQSGGRDTAAGALCESHFSGYQHQAENMRNDSNSLRSWYSVSERVVVVLQVFH